MVLPIEEAIPNDEDSSVKFLSLYRQSAGNCKDNSSVTVIAPHPAGLGNDIPDKIDKNKFISFVKNLKVEKLWGSRSQKGDKIENLIGTNSSDPSDPNHNENVQKIKK